MEGDNGETSILGDTSISGEVQFKLSSMLDVVDSTTDNNDTIADSTLPYEMVEFLEEFHDAPTALVPSIDTEVTPQMNEVGSSDNNETEVIHEQVHEDTVSVSKGDSSNDDEGNNDDNNQPMSRIEMLKLIGDLNASLVTRDEDYKTTVRNLHTEVSELRKELADLKDIPAKLSSHIRATKEKFSELNASNLLLENEVKSLKSQLYSTDKKTNMTTFRYPSFQTTDKLASRVQGLENKLASTQPTTESGKSNYPDEILDDKFTKLNLKLDGLTKNIGDLASDIYNLKAGSTIQNPRKDPSPANSENEEVPVTNAPIKVDCKLLMLFDSNGQYMKPEKMETEAQYVRAAKIHNAISILEECSVERVPEKILINVGINNINDDEENTSIDVCEQYEKLIDVIKSKFNGAHIYISSILVRKDNKFATVIGEVNKNLARWETTTPSLTFVHHTNIDRDMMYDEKHLTRKGFFVMVTNFKYVLYRILPQQIRPTRKAVNKNNNGGSGYSQGTDGSRGRGWRGRGRGRGGGNNGGGY